MLNLELIRKLSEEREKRKREGSWKNFDESFWMRRVLLLLSKGGNP